MDIGSLFFLLGLLILATIFLVRPFLIQRDSSISSADNELSVLYAERERVLNALQDLDFDHSLGKILKADYSLQRAHLLTQGADILQKIDKLCAESTSSSVEGHLDAAIAARRAGATKTGTASTRSRKRIIPIEASPDDELEAMLAARRRERHEKAAGFCPSCGKPVQFSDLFCSKCGASLAVEKKSI